ncbi:GNAT family N-acetyltransferase [Succinimonas amylolytica]|uniref:GNAT family N-acetyltransferase n=1 Tax=Succinimonas amylolytica TaxID=83769 RepID=UPI00037BC87C|nr:GNAT family N-acetyltransferase [Succinimonas amylolytica]
MSVLVTVPAPEDFWAMAQVEHRSQQELEFKDAPEFIRERVLLNYSQLGSLWMNRVNASSYHNYVIRDTEKNLIVGLVCFQYFVGHAYIRSFYILPGYENRHLGQLLLDACVRDARNSRKAASVRLEVFENNGIARRFYERNGFRYQEFDFPQQLGGTARLTFDAYNMPILHMVLPLV